MNRPSPPAARRVRTEDIPQLAEVLARAFEDDPIWTWLYPDDRRLSGLTKMFRVFLDVAIERGGTVLTDDARRGAAIWMRSEARKLGVRGNTRMGAAMATGGARLRRGGSMMKVIEQNHPKEPHWYLALLGTDPDHQGTGVGSSLVRHVIDDPANDLEAAYLETETESNVAFYSRLGFGVRTEADAPGGGPHLWFMWRDPTPEA